MNVLSLPADLKTVISYPLFPQNWRSSPPPDIRD